MSIVDNIVPAFVSRFYILSWNAGSYDCIHALSGSNHVLIHPSCRIHSAITLLLVRIMRFSISVAFRVVITEDRCIIKLSNYLTIENIH